MEYLKYRVQKLFPSDGTVVLQKINTRDRPFKRFISHLWALPPSTYDAVADVDMPLAHCLCPEPEPPRLLPDTRDSTTQVDVPSTTNDLDKWCSLMTDYSSVDRLQQAFYEAGVEARTCFDLNSQLLTDLAADNSPGGRQAPSIIYCRLESHTQLPYGAFRHRQSRLVNCAAAFPTSSRLYCRFFERSSRLCRRIFRMMTPRMIHSIISCVLTLLRTKILWLRVLTPCCTFCILTRAPTRTTPQ